MKKMIAPPAHNTEQILAKKEEKKEPDVSCYK